MKQSYNLRLTGQLGYLRWRIYGYYSDCGQQTTYFKALDATTQAPAVSETFTLPSGPYPGLRGWGAKSSAAILGKFGHLESIPEDWREWGVNIGSASELADTLKRDRDLALLFRKLATLRTDVALFEELEELHWNGPTTAFDEVAARLDAARTETRRIVADRGKPRKSATAI